MMTLQDAFNGLLSLAPSQVASIETLYNSFTSAGLLSAQDQVVIGDMISNLTNPPPPTN